MKRNDGISLLVHTRDSAWVLPRLLESTGWCDERIVVDMDSRDGTREMAAAAGCRVVGTAVEPFNDALRNRFLTEPRCPWTLVLDSDEYLAADAEPGLRALVGTAPDDVGAFLLPRANEFAGQVLRCDAWYPDPQIRLFRTGAIRYVARHHSRPELVDDSLRMVERDPHETPWIHHLNARTLAEFIERQARYVVTDHYEDPGDSFSFDVILAGAVAEFEHRYSPEADGSLSYALALIMYCDRILRGLMQWESAGYRHPLPDEVPVPPPTLLSDPRLRPAVPAVDPAAVAEFREAVDSLSEQLEALHRSRSMRLTAPLRRFGDLVRRRDR